jgi:hypothetical protein
VPTICSSSSSSPSHLSHLLLNVLFLVRPSQSGSLSLSLSPSLLFVFISIIRSTHLLRLISLDQTENDRTKVTFNMHSDDRFNLFLYSPLISFAFSNPRLLSRCLRFLIRSIAILSCQTRLSSRNHHFSACHDSPLNSSSSFFSHSFHLNLFRFAIFIIFIVMIVNLIIFVLIASFRFDPIVLSSRLFFFIIF